MKCTQTAQRRLREGMCRIKPGFVDRPTITEKVEPAGDRKVRLPLSGDQSHLELHLRTGGLRQILDRLEVGDQLLKLGKVRLKLLRLRHQYRI